MLANMFQILSTINVSNIADATKFCEEAAPIFYIIYLVITVLKIAIPIMIVIFGILDLGKAVMAGEEKEIKEAQKMLLKRIIYGALVFFIVTIVQIVFSLIGNNPNSANGTGLCWKCATTGVCSTNSTGNTGNTGNTR